MVWGDAYCESNLRTLRGRRSVCKRARESAKAKRERRESEGTYVEGLQAISQACRSTFRSVFSCSMAHCTMHFFHAKGKKKRTLLGFEEMRKREEERGGGRLATETCSRTQHNEEMQRAQAGAALKIESANRLHAQAKSKGAGWSGW